MIDGLVYRDDIHEYRYRGAVVPSVTQVLAPLSAIEYRGVDAEVLARAAALGKAVHKLIELDLRHDLDVDSLDDGLQPYYTAWQSFLQLSGFKMALSEARVYSSKYGYAGTLDLFGTLNAEAVLIDAKRTAAVPRTAGPQTAAYESALRDSYPDVVSKYASGAGDGRIDRYALHFTSDAKWRLVPFREKRDLRVFLSCQTILEWSNDR